MKKLFLFCLAVGLSVLASAQKVYFIYLQTDDQMPFYVRMADKIYSSSTVGYLILPNLTDSTYSFGLGFPRSTQPEIRFAVTVNQNDKGYILKNLSDGPSLFDMQSLSLVKPVSASNDNTVYETRTDKFSSILSKAADDPGLLKVPVAKKDEPKPKPEEKKTEVAVVEQAVVKTAPVQSTDSLREKATETDDIQAEQKKQENTVTPPVEVKSNDSQTVSSNIGKIDPTSSTEINVVPTSDFRSLAVVRRSESSTTEGFGIVYLDRMVDRIDTIRVLIPPAKYAIEQESKTVVTADSEKLQEKTPDNSVPAKNETTTSAAITTEQKGTVESVVSKPDETKVVKTATCKEMASDKDFMKLRKNMAAKSSDDDMISEAKKVFRTRCFTAEQVRYLSTLFLTAGAKYQFLDASYGYVADKENFSALQSEIKDEYYLKRFKALIGE